MIALLSHGLRHSHKTWMPEYGILGIRARTGQSLSWSYFGGRYWDRTSDLLGVNEALSR